MADHDSRLFLVRITDEYARKNETFTYLPVYGSYYHSYAAS